MVGQGRIGELIQAKPQARRALLEEAAGISGLHTRRHEAELRLRAAEQNLERLDDVVGELEGQIDSLKRQARQASRFKNLSAEIRKAEATLLHLRWTLAKAQEGEARAALAVATALVGDRAAAQMNAAKEQGDRRRIACRSCATRKPRAAAAFQRLSIARAQIEEEAGGMRARQAELDQRLAQLDADIAREERMVRDNAEILERLAAEERTLNPRTPAPPSSEAAARAAFEAASATLAGQRSAAGRADRPSAPRLSRAESQIERALREARRAPRPPRRAARRQSTARLTDIARRDRRPRRSGREARGGRAGCSALWRAPNRPPSRPRRRCSAARAAEARSPAAGCRTPRPSSARIETEARTLARILNAASGELFPAVLEQIKVERGFETALGAALGEDLDAPLDRSAPAHWGELAPAEPTPALPDGVAPLAEHGRGAARSWPAAWRRSASSSAADGARLQAACSSPASAWSAATATLWRWDGFTAGADAPTAAAQRLAQKNRLAELDAEAVARDARAAPAPKRRLPQAEAARGPRERAERAARAGRREAQHRLGAARDALARGRKGGGELSQPPRGARRSARAPRRRPCGSARAAFDRGRAARLQRRARARRAAVAARARQRPTSPRDRAALAEARAAA